MKKEYILLAFAFTFACNFLTPRQRVITKITIISTPSGVPQVIETNKPTLTLKIVTPTPTRTPTPTPTPTPTIVHSIIPADYYVVPYGDTLSAVSEIVGEPAPSIAKTNKLTNPDYLYEGQVLYVDAWYPVIPTPTRCNDKQIVVVLRSQRVYAFDRCQMIKEFVVSTGILDFPTVTGEYTTMSKFESTLMKGPGYYLPRVPWTMYFYKGYGLHGKYWNEIYGRPSSHGCVNMRIDDAHWLYDWSPLGIDVLVVS